jgi:hypothetical protein
VQILRPTSENGDAIIDPDCVLPENFRLSTITEKRFSDRWIRISRLEEIIGVDAGSVEPPSYREDESHVPRPLPPVSGLSIEAR